MTTGRVLFWSLLVAGVLAASLVLRQQVVGTQPSTPARSVEPPLEYRGDAEIPAPLTSSHIGPHPVDVEHRTQGNAQLTTNHATPATARNPDRAESNRGWPPAGQPSWAPVSRDRWHVQDANSPDLRGRNWAGADLAYVDLTNADLRGADLTGAKLLGASLRNADLEEATLASAVLLGADLRGTNMVELQLGPMNISAADLRGANLRGARLASPSPQTASTAMSTNFAGADLRRFDFGATRIDDAVFDNADLRGADMGSTRGRPRSFVGAKYDNKTRFPPTINPAEWRMVKVQ